MQGVENSFTLIFKPGLSSATGKTPASSRRMRELRRVGNLCNERKSCTRVRGSPELLGCCAALQVVVGIYAQVQFLPLSMSDSTAAYLEPARQRRGAGHGRSVLSLASRIVISCGSRHHICCERRHSLRLGAPLQRGFGWLLRRRVRVRTLPSRRPASRARCA
jgi:hypothetical protein